MSDKKETAADRATSANLKGAFTLVLMVPAVVALLVGGYIMTQDVGQGLPLLLSGVVLAVFNVFVLRYLFARLDKAGQDGGPAEPSEPSDA